MDAAEVAANIKNRVAPPESTARVTRYRKAMQELGIVQVNYLVPEDRTDEMRLFADKLRAEQFLRIIELAPDHPMRILLANRNSAKYPTYSEIGTIDEQIPQGNPLRGDLKRLTEHVNGAMRAAAALNAMNKDGGEDLEYIKWSSLTIAHAHMAKYYHDYLLWCLNDNTAA